MFLIIKIRFWINRSKSKKFLKEKHAVFVNKTTKELANLNEIPLSDQKPDPYHFQYLGNSAPATGTTKGWAMSDYIYFRCISCGYMMKASAKKSETCICGKMYKDYDAGRFGSDLGDENIEVYKLIR